MINHNIGMLVSLLLLLILPIQRKTLYYQSILFFINNNFIIIVLTPVDSVICYLIFERRTFFQGAFLNALITNMLPFLLRKENHSCKILRHESENR